MRSRWRRCGGSTGRRTPEAWADRYPATVGTFTSWFGMTLVIIAVAVGVNEVRQDRDRLRSVAIVLGIGLFVVFIPPLQLLRRAEWRAQFGTWSAAAFPPRVDFCGDRYSPAGRTVSLAKAQAEQGGQLKVVANTPAGNPILGQFSPPGTPSGVCPSVLYVESGPNHYADYFNEVSG